MARFALCALLLCGCRLDPGNPDGGYWVATGDGGVLLTDGGTARLPVLSARLGQLVETECTRAAFGADVFKEAYVEVGRLGDAEPFFQWFPKSGRVPDSRMYIASASKWVSGVVAVEALLAANRPISTPLLRKSTSAQGFTFLNDVQPWSPHLERMTVENLLAFTSGLHVKRGGNGTLAADSWDSCASNANSSDTLCAVEALSEHADATVDAGTAYSYGSLHLEVVAAMAEEVSGSTFQQLVDQHVNGPLGVSGADRFWFPKPFGADQPDQTDPNPVPAGSMYTTPRTYRAFLKALGTNGQFAGWRSTQPDLSRTTGLTRLSDPTADTPKYGAGVWQYGLAHWVQNEPDIVSSAGAFGFFPWLDARTGTWGIMGTDLGLSLQDPISSVRCGIAVQVAVRACFERGDCATK